MPETQNRRRTLRPLLWWLLLVLVLFGIRTHQRLMRETKLNFTVTLNNQPIDATVRLDGRYFLSGQNFSPGPHTFTVSNPKTETYTTSFFAWYGAHDLGKITLQRSVGTLSVSVQPRVSLITITGPEFSTTLLASTGTNLVVPTDNYTVTAEYPPYWSESKNITVWNHQSSACNFTPQLGVLHLTANRDAVTYRLQFPNGGSAGDGTLPATINGLPAERYYQLTAICHGVPVTNFIVVRADVTNEASVKFVFGEAHIETVPSGAEVRNANGNYLGHTPIDLLDTPRAVSLTLSLNGCVPTNILLQLVADQTNDYHINLINRRYLSAIREAQTDLLAGNYDGLAQAAAQALNAVPDDANALAFQALANAHLAAQQQAAAAKNKAEQAQQEQLHRTRTVFDTLCEQNPDAKLFTAHEVKTALPAKAMTDAIVKSLSSGLIKFKIISNDSPKPDTYAVTARESLSLGILGGQERVALIVIGEPKAGETLIYFKVLEYQIKAGLGADKQLIPVSPDTLQMDSTMQEQIRLGVKIVNERIQTALTNG